MDVVAGQRQLPGHGTPPGAGPGDPLRDGAARSPAPGKGLRVGLVPGAGLAAYGALLLIDQRPSSRGLPELLLVLGMFAVFAVTAPAIERLAPAAALRWAVGGGAALQVLALRVRPWSTDDHLRYAWDGRVQAAGIDPYRYVPGAPELAALRDAWLFPDGVTPRLNHPGVRTVYPPVAEAWFWLVHALSGGHGRGLQLQVAAAALAMAAAGLLVVVLRRTGGDPRRVVWWSWCPVVVLEAGGNAHLDVLGALLVIGALGLIAARRWSAGGVVLGLAVATKFLPVLVGVGVPPRRSLRVGIAAGAAVVAVYLPHVIAVGAGVSGFLGGYLAEESTDRYDLLRAVLPDVLAAPAGVLVLAGTALWAWRDAGRRERAGEPPRPWLQAALLVGVTFLVLTPAYPWYTTLLVPLVALGASRWWLLVCVAPYPVYAAASLGHAYFATRVVSYGLVALGLTGVWLVRRARPARSGSRDSIS